jgi:hypothetical protein
VRVEDLDKMIKKNDSFCNANAKQEYKMTPSTNTLGGLCKNVNLEVNTEGRFPATILAGSPIDFCEEQLLQAHELMKGL